MIDKVHIPVIKSAQQMMDLPPLRG